MGDPVMLLHGLGRGPGSMRRLRHALSGRGHPVVTPPYPSMRSGLPALVARLSEEIPSTGRLHLVGHSLGGILALRLMAGLPEARRGWVVQIGSPNLGSPLARRVRWLRPVLGPALRDCEPPGPATEISGLRVFAVAGTGGMPALSAIKGLREPNDGIVEVESALAQSKEGHRLIVPGIHMTLMARPEVVAAVTALLSEEGSDRPGA